MRPERFENDRYRIVMLRHKQGISSKECRELNRLELSYADNHIYEQAIATILIDLGFLEITQWSSEKTIDTETSDKSRQLLLSPRGLLALLTLYQSETREKSLFKSQKKAELVGITMAGIGGLITVIKFLYNFIENF